MNLTNIFPTVIANLVFDYCDPIKEAQERNQLKINRAFDEANRKNRFDIISSYSRMCWYGLRDPEEFEYPRASKILDDMTFYLKHKRVIKKFLKENEDI
jgi:hypothetical protein